MKHLLAVIMLLLGLHQLATGAPGPGRANVSATATGSSAAVKMPGQTGISIDAGTGRLIQLSQPAASVFAAEPKVAEVRPASATSLFIFGVSPGRTTVAALDANGKAIVQYDVIVRPSSYGAGQAEAAIAQALPGAAIHIETAQNGLTVTG